jgi:hypothetical protein
MMTTVISRKAVMTEEVPLALAELHIPEGWRLDDWVSFEKQRLIEMYPKIRDEEAIVSYDLRDMLRAADRLVSQWEERRQLVRVTLREEMGHARTAVTPDGNPLAERRIYPVKEFSTRSHTVDSIFRILPGH